MSSYTYTSAELEINVPYITYRLNLNLYTGITVAPNGDDLDVTVTETVDRAVLLSELTAPLPTLSLDKTSDTVTPDGNDTTVVTVTDSRGSAADGAVVKLDWNGILPANKNQITLDSNGQGTVTFGPCPIGQCTAAKPVVVAFMNKAAFDAGVGPQIRAEFHLKFE